MVAAYCVNCGGIFAFSGPGRSPGSKRRVQLREADCPICETQVQAIRFDDLHPKVLELMRQGPRIAAAFLEAYASPATDADLGPDDDPDLRDEIRSIQQRAPLLLPLMLAAIAALIANSKFEVSLKADINQLIEQMRRPAEALPQTHRDGEPAGSDEKKGDAEHADEEPQQESDDVIHAGLTNPERRG